MWKDNNDKIMEILNNIEEKDKECFPVVCPICGKREGHLYFHKYKENDERGSMWTWCSACYHSMHAVYQLPKWWKNLEQVNDEKLTNYPGYLDEMKNYIDEWVNKIKEANL